MCPVTTEIVQMATASMFVPYAIVRGWKRAKTGRATTKTTTAVEVKCMIV
jgi:hypothetical protein